jgi:hypothetical protein
MLPYQNVASISVFKWLVGMLTINSLGGSEEPCPNEGQQPREADLLRDGSAGVGVVIGHEPCVAGTHRMK